MFLSYVADELWCLPESLSSYMVMLFVKRLDDSFNLLLLLLPSSSAKEFDDARLVRLGAFLMFMLEDFYLLIINCDLFFCLSRARYFAFSYFCSELSEEIDCDSFEPSIIPPLPAEKRV